MNTIHSENSGKGTVLNVYGNNAAVACKACGRVFIVSKMINRKGRRCPGCDESVAIFDHNGEVEIREVNHA